jgi:hypothetical protein
LGSQGNSSGKLIWQPSSGYFGRRITSGLPRTIARADPFEGWGRRAYEIPAGIWRVVNKKFIKNDPPGISLLIYVNISGYDVYRKVVEALFDDAVSPAFDRCDRVWIFWHGHLYDMAPGGGMKIITADRPAS